MQEYAGKEGLLTQQRRIKIYSFELTNGTTITPWLLFYLELGRVYTKVNRFVLYIPVKRFEDFVQYAVNACCQGDENPNPSVVGETMIMPANSSFGDQTKDRSRHSATKHTKYKNTHVATNRNLFDILGYISDQLYEV